MFSVKWKLSRHTGGRGVRASVTKSHMGRVESRPKKCHVLFEWPQSLMSNSNNLWQFGRRVLDSVTNLTQGGMRWLTKVSRNFFFVFFWRTFFRLNCFWTEKLQIIYFLRPEKKVHLGFFCIMSTSILGNDTVILLLTRKIWL